MEMEWMEHSRVMAGEDPEAVEDPETREHPKAAPFVSPVHQHAEFGDGNP